MDGDRIDQLEKKVAAIEQRLGGLDGSPAANAAWKSLLFWSVLVAVLVLIWLFSNSFQS